MTFLYGISIMIALSEFDLVEEQSGLLDRERNMFLEEEVPALPFLQDREVLRFFKTQIG